MNAPGKKLYKDPSDKRIAGVCSGLPKYFDLDVTITRVAFAASLLVALVGGAAYLLFWILLENPPEDQTVS